MTDVSLTERQRFWLMHLRVCEKSGLTMRAYAEQHGLSVSSLYEAKRRLRERCVVETGESKALTFVRVESARSTPPPARPCRVCLPNGVTVELGVDSGELGAVLQAAAAL